MNLDAEDERLAEMIEREERIQSAHVIMVPWCQCCEARVEVDHVCGCERE